MLAGAILLGALIVIAGRAIRGGESGGGDVAQAPAVATIVELTPILPTPTPTIPAPPTATPPPQAPVAAAAGRVVCLDPGHGGIDLGNVRVENGQITLQEKDFTLSNALEIQRRLQEKGVVVVLTRSTDSEANPNNLDVNGDGEVASPDGPANSSELDDLQARITICNDAGADLLVSIHYNGAENTALEGYEVWYSGNREFSDASASFATTIHEELGTQFAAAGFDMFDKGIGIEDHAVTGPAREGKLTPSAMPGAVVEGLFLSNDGNAAIVQTPEGQNAIVTAYENAILRWLDENP